MSEETKPDTLAPSKLGTQEYWETLYIRERENNETNPEDKGTVWFDDSNAEEKVIAYLHSRCADEKVPFGSPSDSDSEDDSDSDSDSEDPSSEKPPKDLTHATSSLLDLGCGNASLLLSLRQSGFAGPMTGLDYAPTSIALAQQLAAQLPMDPRIRFIAWDILRGDYADVLVEGEVAGFDVVLDKGTFDAISLCEEVDEHGKRVFESYPKRVLPLVKKGGLLVITSCNWTEEELKTWFVERGTSEAGSWEVAGRVKYKVFSFGGVTGSTISTLCFRRV